MHARAIQRLRAVLGSEAEPKSAMNILREAVAAFRLKPKMLKAQLATVPAAAGRMMATPAFRMPVSMAAEKPSRARVPRKVAVK